MVPYAKYAKKKGLGLILAHDEQEEKQLRVLANWQQSLVLKNPLNILIKLYNYITTIKNIQGIFNL